MKTQYILEVEGIPIEETASNFRLEYTTAHEPYSGWSTAETPVLIDDFSPIEERVEPFKNDQRLHNMSFRLSATDAIAKTYLAPSPRPVAEILDAPELLEASPDIVVSNQLIDQEIYYVADKTFVVNGYVGPSGDGYEYNTVPAAGTSEIIEDDIGSNVYGRPPFIQGRRVWFYSKDLDTNVKTLRWIGKIHKGAYMDRGEVVLPCKSVVGDFEKITRPAALRRYDVTVESFNEASEDAVGGYSGSMKSSLVPSENGGDDPTLEAGPNQAHADPNMRDPVYKFVRVKDSLFPVKDNIISDNGSRRLPILRSEPIEKSEYEEGNVTQAHEVFAITREFDKEEGEVYSTTRELHRFSPWDDWGFDSTDLTDKDLIRYHVLSVGLYFMLEDYPYYYSRPGFVYQTPLSAKILDRFSGASVSYFIDDIETLISKTAEEQFLIDHLIVGWDREDFKPFEFVKKMWKSYGFYLGLDNVGELTINQINLIDVDSYSSALQNKVKGVPSDTLVLESGTDTTTKTIVADYGKLPWNEGNTSIVNALDETNLRGDIGASQEEHRLDFNTISIENGFDNGSKLDRMLTSRALMEHMSIPRLKVRVEDHLITNNDYGIGEHVTLDDLPLKNAWLIDKNGDRIKEITDDIKFTSIIVGRRYLPDEVAYELELLIIGNKLVRWRAPSAIINSVDSANQLINVYTGSNFGAPESDSYSFTIGDEIMIYNPDGTPWSNEFKEIDGIANGIITVDGWWASDPPSSSIVELANLDTVADNNEDAAGYYNPGLNGEFSEIDLVYFFLSDDDDTVGDANDDASTYG